MVTRVVPCVHAVRGGDVEQRLEHNFTVDVLIVCRRPLVLRVRRVVSLRVRCLPWRHVERHDWRNVSIDVPELRHRHVLGDPRRVVSFNVCAVCSGLVVGFRVCFHVCTVCSGVYCALAGRFSVLRV